MDSTIQQRQTIINHYGYIDLTVGFSIALTCALFGLIGILPIVLSSPPTAKISNHDLTVFACISAVLFGLAYVGGYRLAAKGLKGIRLRKRIRLYLNCVINQRMRSADNIARQLKSRDIQRVMLELQEVITLGFLPGFKLDVATRTLDDNAHALRRKDVPDRENKRSVSFSCKSCGANNTVFVLTKTDIAECEYCGSSARV